MTKLKEAGKALIVAGFPDSILQFRGKLIESLCLAGISVHVAVPDVLPGSAVRVALESAGVVVHEIPLNRVGTSPIEDFVLLCSLYRVMRKVRPDVVLGYTVKPVIYGSLAAWAAGVPRRYALITGLGYAFTNGRAGWLSTAIRKMYKLALSRVSKVFFQNPDDQLLFQTNGTISAATPSVVVNGSGVDISEYQAEPLPGAPPRFLMIGRLLGDKGVREYAKAARQVRLIHPDVKCCLVGWIDENPDAIAQAELDCWVEEGCIHFLGRLKDVRPAIANCSVYVLPSYREGTPRTVLEAMAMGRPVITTDAPGCRQTTSDGDNGFLVPVGSADELAVAMLRFIENPGIIPEMGRRSRQIVEEKYDVHKINETMLREMGIFPTTDLKVTQDA